MRSAKPIAPTLSSTLIVGWAVPSKLMTSLVNLSDPLPTVDQLYPAH
ncbi:MAG: hypothetical protein F6K55_06515 [Moorea sp. SIO4A3]|nr:hypothetical protein [Moorena sp. SIO4A3]